MKHVNEFFKLKKLFFNFLKDNPDGMRKVGWFFWIHSRSPLGCEVLQQSTGLKGDNLDGLVSQIVAEYFGLDEEVGVCGF
jgi:hypothetical protein